MTARTWSRVAAVIVVTVIVQVGIVNGLVIEGAHPDLFLLVAIVAGLTAGPQRGAVIAFTVGLVADLFVLTPFGLSSLVYVLVAFTVGAAASLPGGRAPYSFRMVMAAVGGIVGVLLFSGIGALIGQPHLPSHQLISVVAVVAIANAILAIPAASMMSWAVNVGPASRELAPVSGGSALR
jgi:rod shape-determining protein MreD